MKSSEFHKLIKRNGWALKRVSGSHYIYEKEDELIPVPYHGAKEMGEGLRLKITKQMKLK